MSVSLAASLLSPPCCEYRLNTLYRNGIKALHALEPRSRVVGLNTVEGPRHAPQGVSHRLHSVQSQGQEAAARIAADP
jgi:hypothetical protein